MLTLFKYLPGVWMLRRRLGTLGSMKGMAYFQPYGENRLHYQEQGDATFGQGKVFSAYRMYVYMYKKKKMKVYCWDQREKKPTRLLHTLHFYHVEPTSHTLVATGTHRCADDVYKARYTFFSNNHFQLIYQVQGPRKDYVIQTHFRKIIEN